jgi:hypothetical protein
MRCKNHEWSNGKCKNCGIREAHCWRCGTGVGIPAKANTTPVFCGEEHRDAYVKSGAYKRWLEA